MSRGPWEEETRTLLSDGVGGAAGAAKLRGERGREQREGDVGTGHAGWLMVRAAAAIAAESS